MQSINERYIALGSRLKGIPEVLTLGVRPNFLDYNARERGLILDSESILYPTLNYAQFLTTMGKRIFPSLETYIYADDKIKQTTLFFMQDIPHPRTRIYYSRHHCDILKDFNFPFVGKIPRRSSQGRGIYKINNQDDLEYYLTLTRVAYIQEYIPHEKDLRVVLINYEPVLAYWRIRSQQDFRTNLYQGGKIDFTSLPHKAIGMAGEFARMCNFNDVGLDLLEHAGIWYLIEANMQYGREGFKRKNMVLKDIIREKLVAGTLFD